MAAIFQLPRATVFDTDGIVIAGAKLSFFDSGTTTPRTVYSDSSLSTAISQPVVADSSGRFAVIYMQTGAYKMVLADADDVTIYTADNLDSGIPAGSGALAIGDGGTGATTAAGARTALGVAAQSDVDTLSSDVAAIQGQITDVGGTLGALAGLDTIARDQLGTGFGSVIIQRALVDSETGVITCSGTIPYDNSIPQNSEGTEILSGSFTPKSASSLLEMEIIVPATISATNMATIALFRDTTADALNAAFERFDSANMRTIILKHYMSSWGTSASTLAVRGGGSAGTLYANGNSSGTRVGGGVLTALLRVTEHLVF
jgi:hypothetical protein